MNFNLNAYLNELEELVNMDSGQGNPRGITAVAEYFAKRLEARGWIARLLDVGAETGLCAVVKNREAERFDALLVGHVDTVFPMGETARRPFYKDETRAYGLGVLDMKQGCLAMLYALEALPKEALEKLSLVAIFNPDEEIGSPYSAPLIDRYAARADRAFVFEAASTDGSRTVQRKGATKYKIAYHGKAGHAGYLFDGRSLSAVNEMLDWAQAYRALQSEARGTGVNVGVVRGGEKYNIVPDYAQMSVEIRYETREEHEKTLACTEALKAHAKKTGVGVEFLECSSTPPLVPTEEALAYAQRVQAIAEGLGCPFQLKKRGGLSDANHIAVHCPVCLDGMGPTGDDDHSDKEYLELSTVEPSVRLTHAILMDIMNIKEEQGL